MKLLSSFAAAIFALSAVVQATPLAEPLGIISRRDKSSPDYATYVTKGREYWEELQAVLANPDATDTKTIDYSADWVTVSPSIGTASQAAQFAMKNAGLNSNQKFLSETAKAKINSYIYYSNAYSPSSGMIIANNNYGYAIDPQTKKKILAPDRWSAVTWYLWKDACSRANNKDPSGLNYIFRNHIINDDTKDILDDAMTAGGSQRTNGDGTPTITQWTPDDDQFYAALATPNGIGTVYLLKDYPVGTGRKTIESISVFWLNGLNEPYMLISLEPYCG